MMDMHCMGMVVFIIVLWRNTKKSNTRKRKPATPTPPMHIRYHKNRYRNIVRYRKT